MRVLITGVCGFAGSSLAEHLLERRDGLALWGIDNLMRAGSETNRRKLQKLGVNFVHGDIRSASDFESLPAVDWVIDAAANPSVLAGLNGDFGSRQLFEHNLASLVNVLEYCKGHKAGLVLLSTSRVYSIAALAALPLRVVGNAFALDDSAALPPGVSANGLGVAFSTRAPISLYGAAKLACEAMALEYGAAFGLPVWINRCGVLAGAGQFGTPEQGIFSYWINAHLRRRPLRYIGFEGAGRQVRDALHPRDLGALVDAQMSAGSEGQQRIYTVGGGPANAMSLAGLTAWCDARFGLHPPQADPRPRPYDVPWLVMDNCDAQRAFGWRAAVSLESLLDDIARHAERNADWLEISGL
ncbi:MAG TPA: NAD-dependent epimerase/dehydratase family protein [Bryobacteraceae bacterium]|nr:NAD-dependent epimerase/dehydratase family protein [Bryobacteraceae bacterium]